MTTSTPASEPGSLLLEVLAAPLSVCRLPADAPVPAWGTLSTAPFCSLTRTADELSIICPTAAVPRSAADAAALVADHGWRALKLVGPFPLTAVGVLLLVAQPLARAGISILPIATYDTDYVLVRDGQLAAARDVLTAAGHVVRDGELTGRDVP